MYPQTPGHYGSDTSRDAATAISGQAKTLRQQCESIIAASNGLTADEVADKLSLSVLAIRPRITELNLAGVIVDAGHRRKNRSGKAAIVWKLAAQKQRSLF